MLSTFVERPFSDPNWVFELKWDGYRALGYIDDAVHLVSRNAKPFDALFPLLIEDLSRTDKQSILDGEIVVLDKKGHPNFQLMQNYLKNPQAGDLNYYVFDLIHI